MHKRNDLLDELRECRRHETEFKRDGAAVLTQDEVNTLLLKLREYYELNDLETGLVLHGKLFAMLYIDGKFANYYSLANEVHVDLVALYRYRRRYNKLAQKLIER
jgi:hypothetical protein